jgi:anaerobic magnesium-protoporphyrin IX monomethyl ester cyclase
VNSKSICFIDPSLVGKGNAPSLGIGYLASIAQKEGCDVTVLPMEALHLDIEECSDLISVGNYSIVGISSYAASFPRSLRLAKTIKEKCPNIKLILGGIYPTFAHIEIIEKYPFIDAIVRHEGELTLRDIIRMKCNFNNIKGLTYRQDNSVIVNEDSLIVDNLDDLPLPARDLLHLNLYDPIMRGSVLSGRGCTNQCIFCSCRPMFRKFRKRSVASVLEEIRLLSDNYGVNSITFIDDAFTLDKKWLVEFCESVEGWDLKWSCSSRFDTLDKNVLNKMSIAGCNKIFLGIESLNTEVLKIIKKGVTRDSILKNISLIQEFGINLTCGIIIGLPGETSESLKNTLSTLRKMNIAEISPAYLTPLIGTEIFSSMKKYKIDLVESNLENYNYVFPVATTPTFSQNEQRGYFLDFMALNIEHSQKFITSDFNDGK